MDDDVMESLARQQNKYAAIIALCAVYVVVLLYLIWRDTHNVQFIPVPVAAAPRERKPATRKKR